MSEISHAVNSEIKALPSVIASDADKVSQAEVPSLDLSGPLHVSKKLEFATIDGLLPSCTVACFYTTASELHEVIVEPRGVRQGEEGIRYRFANFSTGIAQHLSEWLCRQCSEQNPDIRPFLQILSDVEKDSSSLTLTSERVSRKTPEIIVSGAGSYEFKVETSQVPAHYSSWLLGEGGVKVEVTPVVEHVPSNATKYILSCEISTAIDRLTELRVSLREYRSPSQYGAGETVILRSTLDNGDYEIMNRHVDRLIEIFTFRGAGAVRRYIETEIKQTQIKGLEHAVHGSESILRRDGSVAPLTSAHKSGPKLDFVRAVIGGGTIYLYHNPQQPIRISGRKNMVDSPSFGVVFEKSPTWNAASLWHNDLRRIVQSLASGESDLQHAALRELKKYGYSPRPVDQDHLNPFMTNLLSTLGHDSAARTLNCYSAFSYLMREPDAVVSQVLCGRDPVVFVRKLRTQMVFNELRVSLDEYGDGSLYFASPLGYFFKFKLPHEPVSQQSVDNRLEFVKNLVREFADNPFASIRRCHELGLARTSSLPFCDSAPSIFALEHLTFVSEMVGVTYPNRFGVAEWKKCLQANTIGSASYRIDLHGNAGYRLLINIDSSGVAGFSVLKPGYLFGSRTVMSERRHDHKPRSSELSVLLARTVIGHFLKFGGDGREQDITAQLRATYRTLSAS